MSTIKRFLLFKRIEESEYDRLEYVAEYDDFEGAYKRWSQDKLIIFDAQEKTFYNVGEIIAMALSEGIEV